MSKRTVKWSGQYSGDRVLIPYYLSRSYSEADKKKIKSAVTQLSNWIDCIEIKEIDESEASKYKNKIHVYPGI